MDSRPLHPPHHSEPKQRCVIFLEDGARPDFLFGNASFGEWSPIFNAWLNKGDNHTVCTEMHVEPPTSTTQGIKTLLTGSYPGFIELGQAFTSTFLSSDHLLKQLFRKGLVYGQLILSFVAFTMWEIPCGASWGVMFFPTGLLPWTPSMCTAMTPIPSSRSWKSSCLPLPLTFWLFTPFLWTTTLTRRAHHLPPTLTSTRPCSSSIATCDSFSIISLLTLSSSSLGITASRTGATTAVLLTTR